MNHLLIPDYPMLVLPKLAERIGLNEAVFAQQLHYLCKEHGHGRDGHKWVYNTYDGWAERFPFWSAPQVRRIVTKLEALGAIVSTQEYNKMPMDKTKWYRVNYASQVFDFSDLPKSSDDLPNATEHLPILNADLPNTTELLPKTTHKDYPQRNNNSAGADFDGQNHFAAEFALRLDWQPADLAMVQDRLRGNGVVYQSDLWTDALADFAEYWAARPQRTQTAAAWDAQFIQSARKFALHNRQHYAADGSRAVSGSLNGQQGVSKTAQKAAWLRDAARARLAGETAGKLKPAVFAAVCEGMAGALEAGASRGAPLLEGLPAMLERWEQAFAFTLGQDADGSRVAAAFAALLGQSEQFPTVPMVSEKLPPLLPQFRQPETLRDFGKRVAADEGARAEAMAQVRKLVGGKRL